MKKQTTNTIVYPQLSDRGNITIGECEIRIAEIPLYIEALQLLMNCNVAKDSPNFKMSATTLWDSIGDKNIRTIDVDLKTMQDLQRIAKIGDNLEASITELLNFYSDDERLNIIIPREVLEKRSSYANFTSQLGHTLSKTQIHYSYVKVLFDPSTSRLGIFASKSKAFLRKSNFIAQLDTALRTMDVVFIPTTDIPQTYQTNPAMLKSQLKAVVDYTFKVIRLTNGIIVDKRV